MPSVHSIAFAEPCWPNFVLDN